MRLTTSIAALFITTSVAFAAEPTTEYTAEEAAKHVGEMAIVTGKAERVNKASGGNVFIDLGGRHPDAPFTVFIGAKDAEKVGDVQQYEGKTIAVTGKIISYKDRPEIVVTSSSQITIRNDVTGGDSKK
ncbi:MAG: hypothetical protein ACXV8H_05525 [Chthoniobacterales bacterium]